MKMNATAMRIGMTVLALAVSLLAIPTLLEAQRAAGVSRVGWLEVCGPGPRRPHFDIFRARLAEHGYVEGKNLVFEQRFADCQYDRMPGLAADLVQVPVDVLFTMGTRAARIVAGAVKTIPLVVYSCDPFEHVTRLARPVEI
jgi:putative ABC transport system substrate-binding protein